MRRATVPDEASVKGLRNLHWLVIACREHTASPDRPHRLNFDPDDGLLSQYRHGYLYPHLLRLMMTIQEIYVLIYVLISIHPKKHFLTISWSIGEQIVMRDIQNSDYMLRL